MNQLEIATLVIMAAVVVIVSAWDIYAKIKKPDGGATISWRTRILDKKWPIVGVAVGTVIGHIFWPNCGGPGKHPPQCMSVLSGKFQVDAWQTCSVPVTSKAGRVQYVRLSLEQGPN